MRLQQLWVLIAVLIVTSCPTPPSSDPNGANTPLRSAGCGGSVPVEISQPSAEQLVSATATVEGYASDAAFKVWVIVHPSGAPQQFWVQEQAQISTDCTWRLTAHFGEQGTEHAGQYFEVMAVANPIPELQLQPGQVLSRWPGAQFASRVRSVKRR